METFHRIVGVTETRMDNIPSPPPIPQETTATDAESLHSLSRRGSRVSLPVNRKKSQHSFKRTSRGGPSALAPPLPLDRPSDDMAHAPEEEEEEGEDETFAWGPNHPCFPHPNPHCAPDSDEARTTRVIRVRRDWLVAGDLYPQFANLYPEILDPLITDEEFRFLISNINARLKETFNPFTFRAGLDAVISAFSGFVWDDVGLAGASGGVRNLERFLEGWNSERKAEGRDVRIVQLRRTAFMSLDFIVPDPGLDGMGLGTVEEGEGGIGPAM